MPEIYAWDDDPLIEVHPAGYRFFLVAFPTPEGEPTEFGALASVLADLPKGAEAIAELFEYSWAEYGRLDRSLWFVFGEDLGIVRPLDPKGEYTYGEHFFAPDRKERKLLREVRTVMRTDHQAAREIYSCLTRIAALISVNEALRTRNCEEHDDLGNEHAYHELVRLLLLTDVDVLDSMSRNICDCDRSRGCR